MKFCTFIAIALAAGVSMLGCGSGDESASNNGSGAEGVNTADFVVERPESFQGEFNPDEMQVGLKVGDLAPDIESVDLDGTQFKLSDYRGKVVMLSFWSTT